MNLVIDGWIKVIWLDGHATEESLETILQKAEDIYDVCGDNPLETCSVLAFTVLFIYRFAAEYGIDKLGDTPEVKKFCREQASYFELVGSKAFLQDDSLKNAEQSKISFLPIEIPPENTPSINKQLMHDLNPMSFTLSEVARKILTCGLFGRMGMVKGVTSSISGGFFTEGMVIYLKGDNLLQTAKLNLLFVEGMLSNPKQKASWETKKITGNYTDLAIMTRRFKLIANEQGQVTHFQMGKNGKPETSEFLVNLHENTGLSVADISEKYHFNPHNAYRKTKEEAFPVRYTGVAGIWAEIPAMLGYDSPNYHFEAPLVVQGLLEQKRDFLAAKLPLPEVRLVAYCRDAKQANIADMTEAFFRIPRVIFQDECLRQRFEDATIRGRDCADSVSFSIHIATKQSRKQFQSDNRVAAQALLSFFSKIGEAFNTFLRDLAEGDPNLAIKEWDSLCIRFAKECIFEVVQAVGSNGKSPYSKAMSNLISKLREVYAIYKTPFDEPKNPYKEIKLTMTKTFVPPEAEMFIKYLSRISYDGGKMAKLRASLNNDLNAKIALDTKLPDNNSVHAYLTCARVYALLKGQWGKGNFGKTCASLKYKYRHGALRDRLCLLLKARVGSLEFNSTMISLVNMLGNRKGVDYRTLLGDLLRWNSSGQKVQYDWLSSFDGFDEDEKEPEAIVVKVEDSEKEVEQNRA